MDRARGGRVSEAVRDYPRAFFIFSRMTAIPATILTFESNADLAAAGYLTAQQYAAMAENKTKRGKKPKIGISTQRARQIFIGAGAITVRIGDRFARVMKAEDAQAISRNFSGRPKGAV
ncbi:MAG: hypothetical protein V4498_05065 [candidate division FCPU426 bacterium]